MFYKFIDYLLGRKKPKCDCLEMQFITGLNSDEVLVEPISETCDSGISFPKVITEEDINKLAYYKWEQAGKPEGNSDYFWNQAEQELNDCS